MSNLDKNNTSKQATKTTSNRKTSSKVSSLETKQKENKMNSKKLSLSSINKLSSKFNEKRKVHLEIDGENFEVLISLNLRKTDIQKVVVDYVKFLQSLRSVEGIDEEAVLNSTIVLDILVLKHFSDLPIPELDDISKLIRVSQNLVDLGIVEQLLGGGKNSFSQESIDLIRSQTNTALENMGKALGEIGLIAELNEANKNRIDVDNYFAELELRNFDISEDEDLGMLVKVINQLNAEGTYEEYMSKLSSDELSKIEERINILNKDNDYGETI